MIKLTIDGKSIQAEPGSTVMEAALANGIDIPRLCYHPDLSVSGGCRLCLVDVEGFADPTTSCGTACQEGMEVRTKSELLHQIRRDIIDVFVSEHPLDCVTCEKSGSCGLQKYAYEYDVTETSLTFETPRTLYQDDNPFFLRDHKYCILCGKCVRVCDEIVGVHAIDFAGRGIESHIATPFDGPMIDSTCVFCGNCVQVCPTAALLPMSRLRKGREWDFERIKSICGYCGVGCQIEYSLKDGKIIYAEAPEDAPVNGDFLCTKGRYGWDFATNPERLNSLGIAG
jgi:formate dehydrogenase alpha subunit